MNRFFIFIAAIGVLFPGSRVGAQITPLCECPADTLVARDSTPNSPLLFKATYWWDPVHNQNDLCEGPVNLRITLPDSCQLQPIIVHYEIELDLDRNGTRESILSSTLPPPPGKIPVGNINAAGSLRYFDQRSLPDSALYYFALRQVNNTYQIVWRTQDDADPDAWVVPQLPHGTHRIRWILTDNNGVQKECTRLFTVRDGLPPNVLCGNDIYLNIGNDYTAIIWSSDLLWSSNDFCTPSNQLMQSLRIQGSGSGFPTDQLGNPTYSLQFSCDNYGSTIPVEAWSKDKAGNSAYCIVLITIGNNLGICEDPHWSLRGTVRTETGAPVKEAVMHLNKIDNNNTQTIASYTTAQGYFGFGGIGNDDLHILYPEKNDHHLNGVSTFDLLLMSKHILGIQPLSSPYKLIAADVNRSGAVTNFDIVETRKLILGIYDTFPASLSWRFVDSIYVFPNPSNPFEEVFPESQAYPLQLGYFEGANFTGIKIGDVNNSVIANATQTDERSRTPFALYLPDAELRAGDILDLRLEADAGALGLQFTLELGNLELLGLSPENGMTAEHFGIFPEAITCAWEQEKPAAFRLRLRERKPARLHEQLRISDRITRAEAYRNGATQVPELVFESNTFEKTAILYQNQPNPFSEQTLVPFYLPEAGAVRLLVQDALGRVVFTQNGFFEKGQQQWVLRRQDVPAPGVYTYTLESAGKKESKICIRQ